jgi:hypothetical protein
LNVVIAIGGLPVNDGVEIRKCGSQSVIERGRPLCRAFRSAVAYGRGSHRQKLLETSKFPPPCTSSVLRRTTAFAASLVALVMIVLLSV